MDTAKNNAAMSSTSSNNAHDDGSSSAPLVAPMPPDSLNISCATTDTAAPGSSQNTPRFANMSGASPKNASSTGAIENSGTLLQQDESSGQLGSASALNETLAMQNTSGMGEAQPLPRAEANSNATPKQLPPVTMTPSPPRPNAINGNCSEDGTTSGGGAELRKRSIEHSTSRSISGGASISPTHAATSAIVTKKPSSLQRKSSSRSTNKEKGSSSSVNLLSGRSTSGLSAGSGRQREFDPKIHLNIDEVCVPSGDPRLPILTKHDDFAHTVLGMLQACEAEGAGSGGISGNDERGGPPLPPAAGDSDVLLLAAHSRKASSVKNRRRQEMFARCPAVAELSKSIALGLFGSVDDDIDEGSGDDSGHHHGGSYSTDEDDDRVLTPQVAEGISPPMDGRSHSSNGFSRDVSADTPTHRNTASTAGEQRQHHPLPPLTIRTSSSRRPSLETAHSSTHTPGSSTTPTTTTQLLSRPYPSSVIRSPVANSGTGSSGFVGFSERLLSQDNVGSSPSSCTTPVSPHFSQTTDGHPVVAQHNSEDGRKGVTDAAISVGANGIVACAETSLDISSSAILAEKPPPPPSGEDGLVDGSLGPVVAPQLGIAPPQQQHTPRRPKRTLRQAETEEREEIKSLYNEFMINLKYEQFQIFSNELGFGSEAESAMRETEESFLRFWAHRLTAMIDLHFLHIYPLGVNDTSLTPMDIACLAEAFIVVEPLMTEHQVQSLGFFAAINSPSATVDHGGVAEHTVPPHQRPYYHAYMSAKTAIHLLQQTKEHLRMEEVRDLVCNYFYNSHMPLTSQEKLALEAIVHTTRLSMSRPERKNLVHRVHKAALAAERRFRKAFDDPDDTINLSYQKGEMCGKGSYGKVYRCLNVNNGKFLAMKEIPLPLSASEESEQQIRVEIDTLKSLNHENVVKYFGCKFDRENQLVSVMMEYAPKSLREIVLECGGLSFPLIAHYSRKVLQGLAYLHAQAIIHRDIKAANVLVTDGGEVKLSDFGSATLVAIPGDLGMSSAALEQNGTEAFGGGELSFVPTENLSESSREERIELRLRLKIAQQQARTRLVGTPLFIAPEILRGELPSEASDVWAFGCMIIELVTGKHPWAHELELLCGEGGRPSLEMVMFQIGRATEPPQLPPHIKCSSEFRDFLKAALNLDFRKRAKAKDLLEMPFLARQPLEMSSLRSTAAAAVDELLAAAAKEPASPLSSARGGGAPPVPDTPLHTTTNLNNNNTDNDAEVSVLPIPEFTPSHQVEELSSQQQQPTPSSDPGRSASGSDTGYSYSTSNTEQPIPRRSRGLSKIGLGGTEVLPPAKLPSATTPQQQLLPGGDDSSVTRQPSIRRKGSSASSNATDTPPTPPTAGKQQQQQPIDLDDTLCTGTIILGK